MSKPLVILPDSHPSLSQPCEPVSLDEIKTGRYDHQITEMVVLALENRGLALAANQVGIPARFFVSVHEDGVTIYYNPVWEPVPGCGRELMNEMCLSLMESRKVRRYVRIRATWQDPAGNVQTVEMTDEKAQMFQHESDHLDGIPFSRMK